MIAKPVDEVYRLEVMAKPKVHFGFKPESTDDLRKVHEGIYEAVGRFSAMRDAAIREIETLPSESRPALMAILELH